MMMKISAVARELGCSPDHVRRMIKIGRWPFYRLGVKAIRVDPEEIKRLGRLIAEGEKIQKRPILTANLWKHILAGEAQEVKGGSHGFQHP